MPNMSRSREFIAGITFITLIACLGILDALTTEGKRTASLISQSIDPPTAILEQSPPNPPYSPPQDLPNLLAQMGYEATPTAEPALLREILPLSVPVFSRALLKENDRAAALFWALTPDAEHSFLALKKALLLSFSKEIRGLKDEVRSPPHHPPIHLLTFIDPSILQERFLFILIQNSLYEFHIPEGLEKPLDPLLAALTTG